MASKDRILLPTDVIPSKYYIHLTPNLEKFTFQGQVSVDVDVKKATSTIVVHSLEIKIASVEFTSSSNQTVSAKSISYQDKPFETATFEFPEVLKVGKGALKIKYEGIHNDKMNGFYRSKYYINGEERYMVSSQCEPTGARKIFPCWDEPAHKAVFDVTIVAAEKFVVLSNMEVADRKVDAGKQTVHFAPTPIMSSYLCAFIVGEFDYVEDKTKEGINIKVYTPVGKKEQGLFSLDVAVRCLSYYNDYYGIPYPLSKLDMVAIADFSAGAMENWGLVTYREVALLIDENVSGIQQKQRVAYVVAHELAHQWFGNLVTMEWWKELWLNEGFATFVGNQATDFLFPEWSVWTKFYTDYAVRAKELDSLENSHPIEVEVHSSAEIDEIFDAISYCKGASVIRMISDLVGEDAFKKGLNTYLNAFAYKNAVTEDLWKHLETASKFQVKDFMNPFTKTTGYPLISIQSTANPGEFVIEQHRFLDNGNTSSDQTWWAALRILSSSAPTKVQLHDFKEKKATVTLPVKDADWFVVNAGQSGFFRVKYSADLSAKLSKAVSTLALPPIDRIGLQNDAFALSKAGLLPTAEFLSLVKSYANEDDAAVWTDLTINVKKMASVWSNEPNYPDLQRFVKNLFSKIGSKLGFDAVKGESSSMALLRADILGLLGTCGDEATIKEALRRFHAQIEKNETIPSDIRERIYVLAVANGGAKEYEAALNIFKTAEMHEERLRGLRAISYTKDKDLLMRTLKMSLTEDVRAQDLFTLIANCGNHKDGRDLTWNFMKENFEKVTDRVKDSNMIMERVVTYSFEGFTTEEKAVEAEKFFKEHPVPSAERGIKQKLEEIRVKAKWVSTNRDEVAKFLSSQ